MAKSDIGNVASNTTKNVKPRKRALSHEAIRRQRFARSMVRDAFERFYWDDAMTAEVEGSLKRAKERRRLEKERQRKIKSHSRSKR